MRPPAGLYVHVPFCVSKCPYCDFFSVVAPEQVPGYLDDLGREAALGPLGLGPFDSLYVGGGSPSCLAVDQLAGLLQVASGLLPPAGIDAELEFSIELNPADVTDELLDCLRRAGVNRISLGVQSFDERELRELGRRHDRAGASAAIERIQAAGFASLGLDLIYDLPDQDPGDLRASLTQALAFAPQHLSCYCLTIAPGTPFGQRQARGELCLPAEPRAAELFLLVSDTLTKAGYEHYEVSNFARVPGQRSRHNQKYWRRVACLGLGPAAHSFDGQRRWSNHRELAEYHQALALGLRPVADFEELTGEQARLETLALGLRTSDGVERSVACQPDGAGSIVDRLLAEGLLVEQGERLCPTRDGMLVADGLARLLS